MTLGRELDALVAEKVMGWRWFRFLNNCYLVPPPNTATGFDPARVLRHWDGEGKGGTPDLEWTTLTSYPNFRLSHYSTDIAAAWEVVLKLADRGLQWSVADDEVYFDNQHLYKPEDSEYRFGGAVPVESLPFETRIAHAICLAALKALE